MCERVRRIAYGGMNVLDREMRIRFEQRSLVRAFGELPQDPLDRDARTFDHRLAEHDVRIDFDTVVDGHGAVLQKWPPIRRVCLSLG